MMIDVVLPCNLLALALNIPHLGCDRPSDPANWTQPNVWSDPSVSGAHSDNNYVLYVLYPIRDLYLTVCNILAPNVGLKGLGWHG